MKHSVGVEYALHCLTHLIQASPGTPIGVKELAAYQGVSETYLAKIFTLLKKAGIVRSLLGVKGGYELAKAPEAITFWDVVTAIEGSAYHFQCTEIRQRCVLNQGTDTSSYLTTAPCTIHEVMMEAEEQMRAFLKAKTLLWLSDTLQHKIPVERQEESKAWFAREISKR